MVGHYVVQLAGDPEPFEAHGLLREPLLSLPDNGWINLHFSDLPRWRGAAPVQRALMAGEQELGVTVFRLVEALDAGDVLTRDSTSFAPGTSAGQALTELASTGTDALLAAVALLADDATVTAAVLSSSPSTLVAIPIAASAAAESRPLTPKVILRWALLPTIVDSVQASTFAATAGTASASAA